MVQITMNLGRTLRREGLLVNLVDVAYAPPREIPA